MMMMLLLLPMISQGKNCDCNVVIALWTDERTNERGMEIVNFSTCLKYRFQLLSLRPDRTRMIPRWCGQNNM